MDVCHSLIFFVLTLQDGNTGLVSAHLSVYSGIEGEDVRVKCSIPSFGIRKIFCKEPCDKEDILIETPGATAQRGRYSIDYKNGVFSVTITQLTKSDSGRYRCGAGSSLKQALYKDIEIIVVDAMLDGDPSAEKTIDARTGGNIVVRCNFTQYRYKKYFCKGECKKGDNLVETTSKSDQEKGRYRIRYTQIIPTGDFVYVSINQLTQSDSGWYRCGLDRTSSNDLYQRFRLNVTDALTTSPKTTEQPETTKATDVILYVSLTLVVLVIVSSLCVLVFCRKRICKAKSEEPEPHEKTQCASAPEAEDDPSQHTYSEIKFVSVGSSHSGFHGDAECVIYSVTQVEASSDEPPLYSTVNNPQ
ncbi:polymeric immunoglobulin receptor-like isoform X2 [Trematomus bernacchii]|uniref:polymeric immunoglobulin receptor-like isoform X2 n=1 Tax=Trematomus bernacchii TaxID=40690 RepID=UPI00146EFDF5|nr:polymeric immunoglobulin receptor-like isoform X2 [Trematomus bernacchii]